MVSSRERKESASHPTLTVVREPQGSGGPLAVGLDDGFSIFMMVKSGSRNKSITISRVSNHEESDSDHHFSPGPRHLLEYDRFWTHFGDMVRSTLLRLDLRGALRAFLGGPLVRLLDDGFSIFLMVQSDS